jgi:hypothetical protein
LIGPPNVTRSVAGMSVCRIASVIALRSVLFARLNASAAIRMASKV